MSLCRGILACGLAVRCFSDKYDAAFYLRATASAADVLFLVVHSQIGLGARQHIRAANAQDSLTN